MKSKITRNYINGTIEIETETGFFTVVSSRWSYDEVLAEVITLHETSGTKDKLEDWTSELAF